ncbi:hypothetical protein WA026_006669 [Henosepilachna vigintioctopunctata]|uniref:Uncharacterized protein n=1 Tax=Henosepilachna vigintioctopunctata TaxID=420089 RepID=A0AAW1U9J1_9CUCU
MTSRGQKLVALALSKHNTSLKQREQPETFENFFQPPVENAPNCENTTTDMEIDITKDINLPDISDGILNSIDIPIIFDFIDDTPALSSDIENAPNFENNPDMEYQ